MDSATIKISGKIDESIVDGNGIRFVIFTQGCPHHCIGCQNPDTHDFDGGKSVDINDLLHEIKENPLLKGVTFSGGEPFCQAKPLSILAKEIHAMGLDITTYTGYTIEELSKLPDTAVQALLAETDYLVDGRFDIDKRDLNLRFRGSTNQRFIDLNATRKTGTITCVE